MTHNVFKLLIQNFFAANARDFPWRRTEKPWDIFVSEIMLQQTQTARVEKKYPAWMERFPDAASLAACDTKTLYSAWSGLGYNSRAVRLREAAKICAALYDGVPPRDEKKLLALPGVGKYTARAVMAFAYNIPSPFLETNIRAALLHHFFSGKSNVKDADLEKKALAVLDTEHPRLWYYALMDYGAWLKKQTVNPCRKAAVYTVQSKFDGSARQARGALLRILAAKQTNTQAVMLSELVAESGIPYGRMEAAAAALEREGILSITDGGLIFA